MVDDPNFLHDRRWNNELRDSARDSAHSALRGHVDYVDLAERVVQGVTVQGRTRALRTTADDGRSPRRHNRG